MMAVVCGMFYIHLPFVFVEIDEHLARHPFCIIQKVRDSLQSVFESQELTCRMHAKWSWLNAMHAGASTPADDTVIPPLAGQQYI